MTPNEMLEFLSRNDGKITRSEYQVLLAIIRVTTGYHRDHLRITINDFVRWTNLTKRTIHGATARLKERGLIQMFHELGYRSRIYGLNPEFWGRVRVHKKPTKQWAKKPCEVCHLVHIKGGPNCPFTRVKTVKPLSKFEPKETLKEIKKTLIHENLETESGPENRAKPVETWCPPPLGWAAKTLPLVDRKEKNDFISTLSRNQVLNANQAEWAL